MKCTVQETKHKSLTMSEINDQNSRPKTERHAERQNTQDRKETRTKKDAIGREGENAFNSSSNSKITTLYRAQKRGKV